MSPSPIPNTQQRAVNVTWCLTLLLAAFALWLPWSGWSAKSLAAD